MHGEGCRLCKRHRRTAHPITYIILSINNRCISRTFQMATLPPSAPPLPVHLVLSLPTWFNSTFEICNLLSVGKASAAARKPNIVSKCSGESSSRRQLRPITTLFRRTPVAVRILLHHHYPLPPRRSSWILARTVRRSLSAATSRISPWLWQPAYRGDVGGGIDQQQQQQSSRTKSWLIASKVSWDHAVQQPLLCIGRVADPRSCVHANSQQFGVAARLRTE